MNQNRGDQLEQQLAEMTQWRGENPELWKHALEASSATKAIPVSFTRRVLQWRLPTALAASLAIVFTTVILLAVFSQSVRSGGRTLSVANMQQFGNAAVTYSAQSNDRQLELKSDNLARYG